jgi:hypothetical protein
MAEQRSSHVDEQTYIKQDGSNEGKERDLGIRCRVFGWVLLPFGHDAKTVMLITREWMYGGAEGRCRVDDQTGVTFAGLRNTKRRWMAPSLHALNFKASCDGVPDLQSGNCIRATVMYAGEIKMDILSTYASPRR